MIERPAPRRYHWPSLLSLLFVGACSPTAGSDAGPASTDGGSGALALEIGTGAVDFEPIGAGDDLWVVEGFQGFHVWGSLRVRDIEPKGAAFFFQLAEASDLIAETAFSTDLWEATDGSGRWEMTGISVFSRTYTPEDYEGAAATFRLRVEDTRGVTREAELPVVVRCCVPLSVTAGDGGVFDGNNGLDGGAPGTGGGGTPPRIRGFIREPNTNGVVGIPHSFLVLADDADGDELTYLWEVDEGTLSAPTADGTTWTVASPGEYELRMTVSDGTHQTSAGTLVTFEPAE